MKMKVPERVSGNWFHWMLGGYHWGFHCHGKCWRFRFEKMRYTNCVNYSFWRFFATVPREGGHEKVTD